MKTAHQKYREIIRMIDPFGKNDVLLVNILSASAFAGIYLSLPAEYRLTPAENAAAFPETEECESLVSGKYTMKELSDFYESSMNGNFVMRWYLKRSCFSEGYWQEGAGNRQTHIHGNTFSIPVKAVNILTHFSVIAAFGI